MTPTTLDLYLVSRLDNLAVALTVLLVLSGLATTLAFLAAFVAHNDGDPAETVSVRLRLAVSLFVVFLALGACRIAVPSTAEALAMVVVPRAAQSQSLKSLAPSAVNAVRAWLDRVAEEASR